MRHLMWGLAICLMSMPALCAQQQAPTLGPSRPSLEGPGNTRTANPGRLVKMRTVYIERIDHNLNGQLADDLAHVSWLRVVDKEDDADAIVRGTCFDLRRLKRLHAEVYISDRVTGKSIWQDVVRVPLDPAAPQKAVGQAASDILEHLNESMHTAAKR
ncbi:MAG TPA: hypothetical protein VJW77_00270 [Terriglobia bacterium]|nr:hypothetical protein [Terriglobia bacterium]